SRVIDMVPFRHYSPIANFAGLPLLAQYLAAQAGLEGADESSRQSLLAEVESAERERSFVLNNRKLVGQIFEFVLAPDTTTRRVEGLRFSIKCGIDLEVARVLASGQMSLLDPVPRT